MPVYLQANPNITNRNEMILLTKEMLEWLVGCRKGKEKKLNIVYVRVLKALMELKEFDIEFCLYVNEKEQILGYSKKTRGSIYLNRMCIVEFRHDSEYEDRSFNSLCRWPEVDDKEVVKKWIISQWKDFFLKRIEEKAEEELQNIKEKIKEAENKLSNQQSKYMAIKLALSKNN
jgi:hypothetical protein